MYCKNFQAILVTEVKDGERLMARARCKQWSCAACSETNRKQWRKRIFYHLDEVTEFKDWSFFTLTPHPDTLPRNANEEQRDYDSLKNMRQGLSKFMSRLRRKNGKHEYVRVFERFKKGGYHVHFLYSHHWYDLQWRKEKDGSWTQESAWIKDAAKDCGLGWITHAANLEDTVKSVAYITKYMTKGEAKLAHNIRRIQASRGLTKLDDIPNDTISKHVWSLHHALVDRDMIDAIERNYNWRDVNIDKIITIDNVEDLVGYPFNQPD